MNLVTLVERAEVFNPSAQSGSIAAWLKGRTVDVKVLIKNLKNMKDTRNQFETILNFN